MSAITQLEKLKIKKTPLLLEEKKIDPEVIDYKEKLGRFGIKNTTVKKIDDGTAKVEQKKREVAKKQALNIAIDAFSPFAVIEYATLDKVCSDHELVICNIGDYDRAIPDDNLEEIEIFVENLAKTDESILDKFQVITNNRFSFDSDRYAKKGFLDGYEPVGTEEMFKIAAPMDHFKIPKGNIRVGNEINVPRCKVPTYNYKFKVNKPKPQLDPIVFIPLRFMGKLYCIIVTAWDKVADDSRILSKL